MKRLFVLLRSSRRVLIASLPGASAGGERLLGVPQVVRDLVDVHTAKDVDAEAWRQAARAAVLGEHDFPGGVRYSDLTDQQCMTVLKDAANVVRGLGRVSNVERGLGLMLGT